MRSDGCEDVWQVGFDGFGGNAKQAIPLRLQYALPFGIVFVLSFVNDPIYFNDEEMPLRAKINDERADDGLPPELRAPQLPVPQSIPQQRF